MRADLAEGEVLLGRFSLIRALDADGASHLWIAEDADLAERVALRILDPGLATDRGRQERMRAACRKARQLRHPHIVPVFDFHRDGATCFISRGYIEGENLTGLRGRPPSEIAATLGPVLDALEYAHREGAVHGNLKATKILIDRQGRARIADFLIAGALLDTIHPVGGPSDDAARWREEDLEALAALGPGIDPVASEPESRVAPIAPIANAPIVLRDGHGAVPEPASSGGLRFERRSGVGWAFLGLLVVALGVVFWLPRWVDPGAAPEPTEARNLPASPQPAAANPQADLEARRLLGEALGRRDDLAERGAATWGSEAFRAAEARVAAGEQAQLESNPGAAVEHYQQALRDFAGLVGVAEQRLSEALESGAAALEEWDATAAMSQYEAALNIDPSNAAATSGLEDARALARAQSLLEGGERHERAGDLEPARAAYAEASSAAPDWEAARNALDRLEAELADSEYSRRIARTVAALASNDLAAARREVAAAHALRPESSEARDLRGRIDQKRLEVEIAQGRRRAESFEAKEEWRAAAEQYRALLQLDAQLTFALEGFERTDRRASLSERFDAWIARPGLLYDPRVRSEAQQLLASARKLQDPGPRLRSRIEQVAALERAASTPVPVTFESDGLTEVQIQRVGTLGAFARREVPLKPGTYVIMGIRRGFRDVRQTVSVAPGAAPPTVVVRCVEEI